MFFGRMGVTSTASGFFTNFVFKFNITIIVLKIFLLNVCFFTTALQSGDGFMAGTLVRTPGDYVPIENLKLGDLVLTPGSTAGSFFEQTVSFVQTKSAKEGVLLRLGKEELWVALNQPFYVASEWRFVLAKDLKAGFILGAQGKEILRGVFDNNEHFIAGFDKRGKRLKDVLQVIPAFITWAGSRLSGMLIWAEEVLKGSHAFLKDVGVKILQSGVDLSQRIGVLKKNFENYIWAVASVGTATGKQLENIQEALQRILADRREIAILIEKLDAKDKIIREDRALACAREEKLINVVTLLAKNDKSALGAVWDAKFAISLDEDNALIAAAEKQGLPDETLVKLKDALALIQSIKKGCVAGGLTFADLVSGAGGHLHSSA
jgi:hypothetical protein